MTKYKFIIRDHNIQYPPGKDPVPPNHTELLAQAIPGTTTTIWYGSDVEPSIAVNPRYPSKIVATWQNDRISNGGGLEAGIAYSHNGGKTWKHSVVPFQRSIGGILDRVSDVWLSYSADGKRVFLNALPINAQHVGEPDDIQAGIATSFSDDDGVTWSHPIFNISSNVAVAEGVLDDKNSITADPSNPVNVYCVWDRFLTNGIPDPISFHSDTFLSRSDNKGRSWFPAVSIYDGTQDLFATHLSNGIYNNNQTINNIIVGIPKKPLLKKKKRECVPHSSLLLNFMMRIYAKPTATDSDFIHDKFPYQWTLNDIALIKSNDGGINWTRTAIVVTPSSMNNLNFTGGYIYDSNGNIIGSKGEQLRTSGNSIFDVKLSPKTHNLYVVYQSDQFRSDLLTQIGLRYSKDEGQTWSQPIMVNRTPQHVSNPQAFTPSIAVNHKGYIAITYSDLRHDDGTSPNQTKADVWLAIYKEKKHCPKFITEFRLTKKSYIMQNGPVTTIGIMTNGDYATIASDDGTFYSIYTHSFDGPFKPPTVLLDEDNTVLLLDENRRTAPFVTILNID